MLKIKHYEYICIRLDVKKCAEFHNDKHVVKMILETAQLLCGVHHMTEQPTQPPYKLSHKNHPVLFGLVRVLPTTYGYVSWVWNCVTNILTVMVRDIKLRMLLIGVLITNPISLIKVLLNLQEQCLKSIKLNRWLSLTETTIEVKRLHFLNGKSTYPFMV